MKSFVYLDDEDYTGHRSCSIGSAIAAVAAVITSVGVGTVTAGVVASGLVLGGTGALVGGAISAAEGGDFLKGAESGGLAGLGAGTGIGLAGAGLAGGLSAAEAGALGGAFGGAGGAAATGSNPLLGAASGAAGGYFSGATPSIANAAGTTGTSAGAVATPVGAATGGATDLATKSASSGGFLSNIGSDISKGATSLEGDVKSLFSGSAPTTSAGLGASTGGFPTSDALASAEATGVTAPATGLGSTGGFGISDSLASAQATGIAPTSPLGAITGAPSTAPGAAAGLLGGKITPTDVAALGLGYDVLKGSASPNTSAMGSIAGQLNSQGLQYQSYLNSGTLPAGAQNAINAGVQQSKAAIRQQYQAMGLSGSTAEQQALAAVDINATQQGSGLALQLMNQGVDESTLASHLYTSLVGAQTDQNAGISSAVANFAKTLGGGTLT